MSQSYAIAPHLWHCTNRGKSHPPLPHNVPYCPRSPVTGLKLMKINPHITLPDLNPAD